MENSSKKRRKAPNELPTLPPFTGSLEFTATPPRHRKPKPLILLPKEASERDGRPSWSSGRALAGFYSDLEWLKRENVVAACNESAQSTRALLNVAEDVVVGFERGSNNRGSRARIEMAGENKAAVIVAAEELVQKVMGAWDSSHDPFHALRVRDLALSLACEEGLRLSSFLTVSLNFLIDSHATHFPEY